MGAPEKAEARVEVSVEAGAVHASRDSVNAVGRSTLALVDVRAKEEAGAYDPFAQRQLTHPTTDGETLVHLLKGSLGSGILAMPLAFAHAGLWFGLGCTVAVGLVCTYCVHVLVKCAHELCRRTQTPSLAMADVAETAFLAGPQPLPRYARLSRLVVNAFLNLTMVGCCCIYVVFVASNVKQLLDTYLGAALDVRLVMLGLLGPLLLLSLVRSLKYLAPISMLANCLMAAGIAVTLFYVLQDLPSPADRPAVADAQHWPLFFGTAIFALEGIGVVMSLENNMQTPQNFIGCPGVLNTGMTVVVLLYGALGFLGYLKYGADTKASITLNLPLDEGLGQSVKWMIALSIFFTYGLASYVPNEITWKAVKGYFGKHQKAGEYCVRIGLVVLTVLIAIAVPNLGPFISLIGAVCVSTLGLIFPAVVEIVVYWERPGMGRFKWRLVKNCLLIVAGVFGFLVGTYVSVLEIIEGYGS